MLNTNRFDARADALPDRLVVLLAIADQRARAVHAYVLSAAGFDVVIPESIDAAFSTLRPDIVLVDLRNLRDDSYQSTRSLIRDWRGDVPIVALAPEVGWSSCERARSVGCAAVCLSTCSAEILAAGLRAVLERSRTRQDVFS